MTNETMDVQKAFFGYLINRFGPERTLQNCIESLQLKKGAVYKRMSGETMLSAAEMVDLSIHFKVSLDTIFNKQQYISFEHPFSGNTSIKTFFEQFTFFLKPLGSTEKSHMIYLANELPIFHYFSFPALFNFSMSIWDHLHWEDKKLHIKKSESLGEHPEIIRSEISKYYNAYKVTEIWNNNMFANLYQQIIFAVTIKAFESKQLIDDVIVDISKLIDHLYEITTGSPAENQPTRNIYLNEFGNYLNIVLYESDKINTTFVGYDIPQFIVSYNSSFYNFSKNWIKKLRRRSSVISGEGYQTRELFFQKVHSDFESFRERVTKLSHIYYE